MVGRHITKQLSLFFDSVEFLQRSGKNEGFDVKFEAQKGEGGLGVVYKTNSTLFNRNVFFVFFYRKMCF